jgi:hypothetical protein
MLCLSIGIRFDRFGALPIGSHVNAAYHNIIAFLLNPSGVPETGQCGQCNIWLNKTLLNRSNGLMLNSTFDCRTAPCHEE